MTEENDQILSREWLAGKLERDHEQREREEQETAQERAVEGIRQAWIQETGVEPTQAQVDATLAEKRRQAVAETARRNEQIASRQVRGMF
jgi:hypothetical protein